MSIRCRPLTDAEVTAVLSRLETMRDKCLFILGIRTGFRIAELCSVKVADVYQYGKAKSHLSVAKSKMKGENASRSVALHPEAKSILEKYVVEAGLGPDAYLFKSREGFNRPLSTCQAWRILKKAYSALEIGGPVATHSMRKTFAHRVYQASGQNIFKAQRALGHKSLDSTIRYLAVDQNEIDDLVTGLK